jgi:hypothetical protein
MSVNKFSFIQEVYKVKTFGTTHARKSLENVKYFVYPNKGMISIMEVISAEGTII